MTTTVVQVSDTHFGAEVPAVVEALVAFLVELRPDVLVLSGDVTQRARAAEFRAAAAFLERLRVPHVLAIPGNHDIPLFDVGSRLLRPYAGFHKTFGGDLEPSFENADCLLLCVKTTRRYRHIGGEISEEQRERVARRMQSADPEKFRAIVLHQPIAVPRASEQKNVVRGHQAAIECWASSGADVILGGHIHLPYILPLHEQTPALTRLLWAVNAGSAVSRRVRHDAGNAVNVFRFAAPVPGGFQLEQWGYDGASGAFRRAAEQFLPCGPR